MVLALFFSVAFTATAQDTLLFADYQAGRIDTLSLGFRSAHVPDGFLPELERARPRVALALSGGGARGLAHIGVLQGVEEYNLPVDYVVGTSMGGVIAGLYGSGYSTDELVRVTRSLDWSSLFTDAPSRRNLFLAQKETANQDILTLRFRGGVPYIPDALVSGQTLFLETFRLIRGAPYAPVGDSFDGGRMKIGLVTTDIVSGDRVFLDAGDLALSLRATMAVPIIFRPYRDDGHLLVDGGASENIPVRAAKSYGADIVIAVDCTTPTTDPNPDMPWEILNQVTTLMTAPNDSVSRSLADLLISPDLTEFGSTEFENQRAIVEAGRRAFDKNLDSLLALIPSTGPVPELMVDVSAVRISSDAPQKLKPPLPKLNLEPGLYSTREINLRLRRLLAELRRDGYGMAWVDSWVEEGGLLRVHINIGILGDLSAQGVDEVHASVQLRELSLNEGDVLRTDLVLDALRDLQATQRYTTAYCELDRLHDGTVGLTFLLEPAPPVRLGLGLGYGTDWGSRYRASLVFEQPFPIIGEELRLTAKYGERRQHYGIMLRADRLAGSYAGWQGGVEFQRADVPRFDAGGNKIGTAFVGKTSGTITALFNLSTWGRLSAGTIVQRSEDMLDGSLRDNFYSAIELSGELDTEDRRPFPTSGVRIDAEYAPYSTPFNGERSFSIFDLHARGTVPLFPRWVGQLEMRGGVAESTTPSSHRFAIGGLQSIPAFSPY
ncbi:MAG: patatin-like phospholipase family protein, partial [Chloroflexota bacterium]